MRKIILASFLLAFSFAMHAQQTKLGRVADRIAIKTKIIAHNVAHGTKKTAVKVADKSEEVAEEVKGGTVRTAHKAAGKTKETIHKIDQK